MEKDGSNPKRCFSDGVTCKDECDALESCIAYGMDHGFCYLFISAGSCRDGWISGLGDYAMSGDDLTVGPPRQGATCVIKGEHILI